MQYYYGVCFFRIYQRYDAIATRVSDIPETTDELVELAAFLKKSSEETVYALKEEIGTAAERLEFLLECATMPCEYFTSFQYRNLDDFYPHYIMHIFSFEFR